MVFFGPGFRIKRRSFTARQSLRLGCRDLVQIPLGNKLNSPFLTDDLDEIKLWSLFILLLTKLYINILEEFNILEKIL